MSKPSLLSKVKSAGALKLFVTATVAEVLNPKTALFFLAFSLNSFISNRPCRHAVFDT
ncbi:hypothetical protein [Paenibacillus sp. 79R4]